MSSGRPESLSARVAAICFAAAALSLAGPAAATPASGESPASTEDGGRTRPNVLILMCDQLNPSVLSCYGGSVSTPSIDRIAREGVRFNHATCPTPFCSPTRASVATGLYPHAHGIVTNCSSRGARRSRPLARKGITAEDVTGGKLLHAAGYATHHYGKWHLFGDDLPYYRDMFCPGTEYVREMAATFEEVRRSRRGDVMRWYGWWLPVEVAPELRAAVEALGDRWKGAPYAGFITKMGRLLVPVEQYFDVRVGKLTVERIRAVKGRPFLITCSFNGPHDPNVVPSPYYEAFPPERIQLAANRNVREERFERQWSRRIVADLGEPGLREFLRIYYGMVQLIDHQVGSILGALEAGGQMDNTIIVFTADHGDMAGGHGMVWKSTDAFYDEVVRVPLLIRFPGRIRPQQCDLAVGLTDLLPTLLDLVGLPIPQHVQGQDLVPYLTGARRPSEARRFSFSERIRPPRGKSAKAGGKPRGSFMIRGQGWKYIRYDNGEEYMYHLAEDPGETKNVIGDVKHASRRKELAAELDAWLLRTGWGAQRQRN